MAVVDVGLVSFDVASKKHAFASAFGDVRAKGEIENTPSAVRSFLTASLKRCRRLRVLMEATGVYYLDLALIAAELGAEVMVVNPKAAHHFSKAMGTRNKTDRIDAGVLLTYLERMDFVAWQAPSPERLALRQFGRHLGQLVHEGTAVKNRLHALESTSVSPKVLRDDLKRSIQALDRRIIRLTAEALKLVHSDPTLSTQFAALETIIGVGEKTALSLLAELVVLPQDMDSRAVVCHAGLDVRIHQSGSSVAKAPKLTKHGNKYLRRALFMPAMSAVTHDPHAGAFRDRLVGRGKQKMQAIAAVMRKTLTVAWALYRQPGTYDGSRLYAPNRG